MSARLTRVEAAEAGALENAIRRFRKSIRRIDRYGSWYEQSRSAIRDFCTSAKESGLPPERLLIELKRAFADAAAQGGAQPDEREDRHRRLISFAIATYFEDAARVGGE